MWLSCCPLWQARAVPSAPWWELGEERSLPDAAELNEDWAMVWLSSDCKKTSKHTNTPLSCLELCVPRHKRLAVFMIVTFCVLGRPAQVPWVGFERNFWNICWVQGEFRFDICVSESLFSLLVENSWALNGFNLFPIYSHILLAVRATVVHKVWIEISSQIKAVQLNGWRGTSEEGKWEGFSRAVKYSLPVFLSPVHSTAGGAFWHVHRWDPDDMRVPTSCLIRKPITPVCQVVSRNLRLNQPSFVCFQITAVCIFGTTESLGVLEQDRCRNSIELTALFLLCKAHCCI